MNESRRLGLSLENIGSIISIVTCSQLGILRLDFYSIVYCFAVFALLSVLLSAPVAFLLPLIYWDVNAAQTGANHFGVFDEDNVATSARFTLSVSALVMSATRMPQHLHLSPILDIAKREGALSCRTQRRCQRRIF
ncbi:hypothetical protein Bpfe_010990 [Biomphalaria pfeifferi]|uniref:Uncharacterized protein n=1 Tax=Biomphalaria pfeifferi TaxID=112525 RepID=A0AAD8BTJ0_BIOPF|nr:hypothetical protein Bpfe_010990 [Biomphalaria pfeifferi]